MPHALIVDDDLNTREALVEITTAEGFTTAIAGNMQDAKIQINRQRPDVVLIDLKLPDGALHVFRILFKLKLRGMYADDFQSGKAVLFVPGFEIRNGAETIDAGVGPKID